MPSGLIVPHHRKVDLGLAILLTPVWLVCLGLHAELVVDGRLAWLPLYVEPAASPDDFPIFLDHWADAPESNRGLRAGDRMHEVGGTSLQGAGRIGVLAATYTNVEAPLRVRFLVESDGTERTQEIDLLAHSSPWHTIPLTIGLGLAALIALIRGRGRRSARAFALAAMSYSLVWLLQLGGPGWQTWLGLTLLAGAGSVFLPLTLDAALDIPERLPSRRKNRYWVWVFAAAGPLLVSWLIGWPIHGAFAVRALVLLYLVFAVALLAILANQYRRADARGRRQLKWILLGFYVGLSPMLASSALTVYDPGYRWLYEMSLLTTPLIPTCILIAIIHASFLDIDRILTTTLAYSISAPLIFGLILTVGVPIANALAERLSVSHATAMWILAVSLAAPGIPVARAVRPRVEHWISADHLRTQRSLRTLRSELDGSNGPGPLLRALGKGLAERLLLDRCAVYARTGDAFTPVETTGSLVPPGIDASSSLTRLLAASEGSTDRSQWRRWSRSGALAPVDAALLETLEAEVILPLLRGDLLFGFACLGQKESGDIYSKAELAALESLAIRISNELQLYDEQALRESQQRLGEEIRDYVPSRVAEAIERGQDIEIGEVDVSVLFVDIRGYTPMSETRGAAEVFEITNEYTRTVSELIDRHGGIVVEFQGDGLMAVFGAPLPLAHKEREALQAAREVFESVGTRRFGTVEAGELSVGVGIATGPAYAGNLYSTGQRVWSVMGNTTNLAARLEGLTRDLEAAIVIDDVTFARTQEQTMDFVRFDRLPLKGRSDPITAFALPLPR